MKKIWKFQMIQKDIRESIRNRCFYAVPALSSSSPMISRLPVHRSPLLLNIKGSDVIDAWEFQEILENGLV